MKTMENNEVCTFGDFAAREIIDKFTEELLKEYPFLSEEEAREFIQELSKQIKYILHNSICFEKQ